MDADEKNSLLAQEYMQLQKVVEDYDQRVLTIKAWSVTFSAAGLATAYLQDEPLLLLIAALSALTFWIIEALWKTNQQAYYPRIKDIERYFGPAVSGETRDTSPFRIGVTWSASFRKTGKYWRATSIMLWPHVALPHLVVILAGLSMFGIHIASGWQE
jgi:hypothetical protein